MGWVDGDYEVLLEVANACHFAPEDWLSVATFESGLKPTAYNAAGHAKGLTQLTPVPLKSLGWVEGNPDFDSTEGDYCKLPICHQIRWSGLYFDDWRKRYRLDSWESAVALYLCNFAPAYLPLRQAMTQALYTKERTPQAYEANKGLDVVKKGAITVGDLAHAMARAQSWAVYKSAMIELNRIRGSV